MVEAWTEVVVSAFIAACVVKCWLVARLRADDPAITSDRDTTEAYEYLGSLCGAYGPVQYRPSVYWWRRRATYRFYYARVDGSWRAYILETPSLRGRPNTPSLAHFHTDGVGAYVCWDRKITDLDAMRVVARTWARSIEEYIVRGAKF